jgi:CRP-like cAMP-binding protein
MTPDQQRVVLAFLRKGTWFAGFEPALQDAIVAAGAVQSFPKGHVVVQEGGMPQGLSALLTGRLWLVRHLGTDIEHLVHVAEPGFWFGEPAVLTGGPAVLTTVAQKASRAFVLVPAAFEALVARYPHLYRAVTRLLVWRYGLALRDISEVHRLSAEGGLCVVLADRADMRAADDPATRPISLKLSQEELARLVGMSRQTLNGLLKKLEADGLVRIAFREVLVPDPGRLRRRV